MKLRWSLLILALIFCLILPTTLSVPTLNTDVEGTSGGGYISEDAAPVEARGATFDIESVDHVGASDWPVFRHDLCHTGYSSSLAPNTVYLLWRARLEG